MMLPIGCEKETPVGPSADDQTAIVLEHTSLEVDADGGKMEVGYSVENPISGAKALLISDAESISMWRASRLARSVASRSKTL